MIARYQGRLSGPLLDRIDLQVEVPVIPPTTLSALPSGESSAAVAQRVALAQARQYARQGGLNAALAGEALDQHCSLAAPVLQFLEAAATRLGWSARSFHRVLRVARTAADLSGSDGIALGHLAEAIQYRRALVAD